MSLYCSGITDSVHLYLTVITGSVQCSVHLYCQDAEDSGRGGQRGRPPVLQDLRPPLRPPSWLEAADGGGGLPDPVHGRPHVRPLQRDLQLRHEATDGELHHGASGENKLVL